MLFLAFFLSRQTQNQGKHSTAKKVNGLRDSTSKQHTINLVPRAFSMAGKGKGPGTKVEHTGKYVLGQYPKSIERLLYYK